MRSFLAVCLVLVFSASAVVAEPILTKEAKCLEVGNIEVGFVASYGVDAYKIKDVSNSDDYEMGLLKAEVPINYGVSEKLQVGIGIPYRSWKFKVGSLSSDEAGVGQVCVNSKFGICDDAAVAVSIQTPTGDVDKMLGEGTNAEIMAIASKNLDPLKVSGNVGYLLKTKYKDEHKTEYFPASAIIARVAVEYPAMDAISLIGEAQGQMFGKVKYTEEGGSETSVKDSAGTTIDMLVGGQYTKDAMSVKLGVSVAVGGEDYRAGSGLFHFYDSYDWKVILSGTYKFGE